MEYYITQCIAGFIAFDENLDIASYKLFKEDEIALNLLKIEENEILDEEIEELLKECESKKTIDELNLFKNNEKNEEKEKNDIKIRFFKLSFIEDELMAEEYITWEGIVKVAKFMGLC